jgi:DNA-binding transcriptional MocR family regulator
MGASEIRELLKLLDQPDIISFAGGIPDPALFPAAAIAGAYQAVLADSTLAGQALQYSVSEGYLPLREWIARRMAGLGAPCAASNILITSGSQQALDFLGKLLLSPGDTALVTAPTYLGALQAFNAYEPRYDTLPAPGSNRTAATYRQAAASNGGRVKFAYMVPDFANPTGETVPLAAREQTLDLAEALGVPVIEDAAYTALRYDGTPVPALLALDIARNGGIDATRTIYCGTFSKTLAPALRAGFVCAAQPIIDKLVLVKQASDLHNATINQMVIHRVAETVYDTQIETLKRVYRHRRDAMLAALETHMPKGVSWSRPEGGMFVWATLPEGFDGKTLLARAIEKARVAFVPGSAFFADGTGRNTIRMSYSLASDAKIDEGIGRLGRLIASGPA